MQQACQSGLGCYSDGTINTTCTDSAIFSSDHGGGGSTAFWRNEYDSSHGLNQATLRIVPLQQTEISVANYWVVSGAPGAEAEAQRPAVEPL